MVDDPGADFVGLCEGFSFFLQRKLPITDRDSERKSTTHCCVIMLYNRNRQGGDACLSSLIDRNLSNSSFAFM